MSRNFDNVVPRSRHISAQSSKGPQALPFLDARNVRSSSSVSVVGVAGADARVCRGGWMPGTGGG
eukprot:scaffold37943_cov37-Attheya_sp.AAC.2